MILVKDLKFSAGNFSLSMDMKIEKNTLAVIMGPSGCGKSTFLKLLCGILKPESGKVQLEGTDLLSLPMEKRGIGMIFQDLALFPHMSVKQNILFPMQVRKKEDHEKKQKLNELAELLKLKDLLSRNVQDLSGGERQRTAIARTLAAEPKILLLDEPYSSLDAVLRDELRQNLKNLRQELGIPVIFVTHDRQEAFSLADELFIMKDGHIIDSGSPSKVYEQPVDLFTAQFTGLLNRLPVADFSSVKHQGDFLYFRPNALCSSRPNEDCITLELQALSEENLGTHRLIRYRYKDQIIISSTTESRVLSDKIQVLYLPHSRCLTFKEDLNTHFSLGTPLKIL